MDALSKAALESLVREVLPKLASGLAQAQHDPATHHMHPDLRYLIREARELLGLVESWTTPSESANDTPHETTEGEMSDEEALRLLAAMDEPIDDEPIDHEPIDHEPVDHESVADEACADKLDIHEVPMDSAASAAPPTPTEMSDEEAQRLLAAMDEPLPDAGADDFKKAAAVVEEGTPTAGDDEADVDGTLDEIEEFVKNEFTADPDMMSDFSTNADELMETLDQMILQLEQNPHDRETIESIFRAAHTLKGAAGMFGFKAIERVMHRMENLFDRVRKGTLVPTSDTIDVVFQGLDVLRTLLEAAKSGKPSGIKTVPIVHALERAAKGRYVKGSMQSDDAPQVAASGNEPTRDQQGKSGAQAPANKKKSEQSTIRVDLERLDMLVNLVGELVIDRTRFASIEEEIRSLQPQAKVSSHMSETVQLFGRHMNEIHEIIMKIRMVPIGNAFNKYPRIVRDLSRQLGKEIELHLAGEETELDKTLVEQIGDPLIHLIRNSCDHGIESPEARVAAGKSRVGKIFLSARQEGNHIIITIEDDGKGIPAEAIRKKAIERGLINEETVLPPRDIFNLIFEPGFSTAEQVTTISGRGVGMDVVRKQISKLKGLIEIDSEPGKGTVTSIRLPLTLAIVQSLLVESAGEVFAIPLSAVIESVRIKPEDIQYVGDTEVIKRHDKVLPLMHLHDSLSLPGSLPGSLPANGDPSRSDAFGSTRDPEMRTTAMRTQRRKQRLYVVIVGSGERRFGIVVDQLLNQQEMVIKSMGPLLKHVPCVAGGAVLGNGEVVLVLDVQELENRFRLKARSKAA